jgi:hypothetical protein
MIFTPPSVIAGSERTTTLDRHPRAKREDDEKRPVTEITR